MQRKSREERQAMVRALVREFGHSRHVNPEAFSIELRDAEDVGAAIYRETIGKHLAELKVSENKRLPAPAISD